MDIGFYQFKPQIRSYLQALLPYVKQINPTWISLCLIPVGLLTAWVYAESAHSPWLYLVGCLLIALRIVIGTLDGMVAETTGQVTPKGTLINHLCPEFADIALMLAIASTAGVNTDLAIWALAVGWATSYLSLTNVTAGGSILHSGPVSRIDRLIILAACSFLAALFKPEFWMELFLWWCIFGGLVTCCLRLMKQLGERVDD